MEEYCFDVEKAIDYAFSEQKFVMNFYQYLKGKEAKRAEAKTLGGRFRYIFRRRTGRNS
jgi:hypothetical protein